MNYEATIQDIVDPVTKNVVGCRVSAAFVGQSFSLTASSNCWPIQELLYALK